MFAISNLLLAFYKCGPVTLYSGRKIRFQKKNFSNSFAITWLRIVWGWVKGEHQQREIMAIFDGFSAIKAVANVSYVYGLDTVTDFVDSVPKILRSKMHHALKGHLSKISIWKSLGPIIMKSLFRLPKVRLITKKSSMCHTEFPTVNRNKINPFLICMANGDEKWVFYDKVMQKRS